MTILNIYCFIIRKGKHYFKTITDQKEKTVVLIAQLFYITCFFTSSKEGGFFSLKCLLAI